MEETLSLPQSMTLPSLCIKCSVAAFVSLITRAFNDICSDIISRSFLVSNSSLWRARIISGKVPEEYYRGIRQIFNKDFEFN